MQAPPVEQPKQAEEKPAVDEPVTNRLSRRRYVPLRRPNK